uniref:Uncharacterized protein n=1 Tax=Arsenophonus endosymbiont of Trialeurodes vaporariorum TaxID=235567 RepID=A0A3B0M2T6_9GAMM
MSDEVREKIQEMIEKSSELYHKIVFLEEERQTNRNLISTLQEKIKRTKNFHCEFKKYKPYKLASGTFIYIYDNVSDSDDLLHYICTKCVNDEVISILQPQEGEMSKYAENLYTVSICHHCSSKYLMESRGKACYVG